MWLKSKILDPIRTFTFMVIVKSRSPKQEKTSTLPISIRFPLHYLSISRNVTCQAISHNARSLIPLILFSKRLKSYKQLILFLYYCTFEFISELKNTQYVAKERLCVESAITVNSTIIKKCPEYVKRLKFITLSTLLNPSHTVQSALNPAQVIH